MAIARYRDQFGMTANAVGALFSKRELKVDESNPFIFRIDKKGNQSAEDVKSMAIKSLGVWNGGTANARTKESL